MGINVRRLALKMASCQFNGNAAVVRETCVNCGAKRGNVTPGRLDVGDDGLCQGCRDFVREEAAPIGFRATRYDSGFGTVDYTCDECGQQVKSRTLPDGWSDEGGNRHRCPDHRDWPHKITCETCPATVGYDDDTFESRVVDQWTPESEVTGGALCPACAAKWLDADGLLKPGAPVRAAVTAARRIVGWVRPDSDRKAPPGPAVRQREEMSRRMEFPLIPDFVWTGEDLNPWRCGNCATTSQREKAERMGEAELEPPRLCGRCGISF